MNRFPLGVYRAMRARSSYLSAFVPLSNDFFACQNRRRNAILVDVIPPSNLGHFPQDSIANGLVSRFGGYPSDFHVARYRERDCRLPPGIGAVRTAPPQGDPHSGKSSFAAFLGTPTTVPVIPLSPRGRGLDRSVYYMSVGPPAHALVGGFARFIRADDFTVRMVDLSGYRCFVDINHLSDIPENLEISFGDVSISVLIQLERWARAEDAGGVVPRNERTDQNDPHLSEPPRRSPNPNYRSEGSYRGRFSSTGGSSNSDASWNSSEIRDRRRPVPPASAVAAPGREGRRPPPQYVCTGVHDDSTKTHLKAADPSPPPQRPPSITRCLPAVDPSPA